MNVAIVYDRVNKWGGAERVLLALNKLFPDAPLFTSVYNKETAPWANVFPKVIPSFLQKLPFARTNHEYLALLMPLAFESFDFSEFDLVISVTSEAAKGIVTTPKTRHICMCLTPTRYLWSGYGEYFRSPISRLLSKPVVSYLRTWDKVAAGRPDEFVAISTEVQKRISQYYNRESHLVFPPVSFPKSKSFKKKDYYLIVSRLVPYKRVDLAINVFNELQKPLVIVGKGSEELVLKNKAQNNVTFISDLTDEELVKYYSEAKALLMPQVEDFGLVAIEAQSLGTPVIAYAKGGSNDTIIPGKTGIVFHKQTPIDLKRAIIEFESKQFKNRDLRENAKRFSQNQFRKELQKIVYGSQL